MTSAPWLHCNIKELFKTVYRLQLQLWPPAQRSASAALAAVDMVRPAACSDE